MNSSHLRDMPIWNECACTGSFKLCQSSKRLHISQRRVHLYHIHIWHITSFY